MTTSDFDQIIDSLAQAVALSRKMQADPEPLCYAVPRTTNADEWAALIARLNAIDPDGGWGRMEWGGVQMVVSKAEWTQ